MISAFDCLEELPAKLEDELEFESIYEKICMENAYKNTEKILIDEPNIEEIYLNDNAVINNVWRMSELDHSGGKHSKTVLQEYFCFICNYQTKKKDSLRKHLRLHSLEEFPAKLENKLEPRNIYNAQCVKNEYKNTEKIIESEIEEIYLSDNGTINNVCETFELVHSGGEDPKTVPQEYFCFVCNYQTTKKVSLKRHCRIHSNKKAYHCSLCDFKTSKKAIFESHLNIHVIERNFNCSICEYRAISLKLLSSHMRTKHGPKKYLCGVCNYKTSYKSNLYMHIRMHIGERKHLCTVCGYKIWSLGQLNRHMVIHGEKRLICYICGHKTAKKISIKSHIIGHIRRHEKEVVKRTLKCTICDFKTAYKSQLSEHMKQFECIFCVYKQPHIRCRAKQHLKVSSEMSYTS